MGLGESYRRNAEFDMENPAKMAAGDPQTLRDSFDGALRFEEPGSRQGDPARCVNACVARCKLRSAAETGAIMFGFGRRRARIESAVLEPRHANGADWPA